jgi:hypothetical protein
MKRLGRISVLVLLLALGVSDLVAQVGGGLPPMRRKAQASDQTQREVDAASAVKGRRPTPPPRAPGGGSGNPPPPPPPPP